MMLVVEQTGEVTPCHIIDVASDLIIADTWFIPLRDVIQILEVPDGTV